MLRRSNLEREDWENLENYAMDYIERTGVEDYKSFKGYFYYGIALYRQGYHEDAVKAFKQAESLNENDAQLHYNLGLSYFKLEAYDYAV